MINLFNEGFEQVVLPHIVRLEDKMDGLENRMDKLEHSMGGLEKRVENLEMSNDRIERKLNAVIERQDEQGLEIKKIRKFIQMPEMA